MTVYTSTARFDTGRAMTEDEMRKIAPSIFATSAHESRSDRFQPIPTIEILRGLTKEGFMPVGIKQSASRIEGTHKVLDAAEAAIAAPQDWSTMRLNADEKAILAEAAHVLRFGDADGEMSTPIKPAQLFTQRRTGDMGDDLWTTWNVVQENAIKGGIRAVGRDDLGRRRRVKSRAVNGIDQDIKLNKALWILGDKMAELKGAR